MRIIYSSFLYLLSPVFLFFLCRTKKNKPKIGGRWLEFLGVYNKTLNVSESKKIWYHASSVGEVMASKAIIKKLRKKHPEKEIIITTMTSTGAREVEKLINNDFMISHFYFPIDTPGSIKRFIKKFKPEKLIIMEMELWPNVLYLTKKMNINTYVINARLSDKSFLKYKKYSVIKNMIFPHIYKVLAQYPNDANNFIRLGLNENSVFITGSIKFDSFIDKKLIIKGDEIRIKIGKSNFVWSAASTHQGEEEMIFEAHKKLLSFNPFAKLIIIPRHPERFSVVKNISEKQGFKTVRYTELDIDYDYQVYVGDTMGELPMYIQSSDVCFMGGSLLGDKVGGHNLLEPAYLNKIILMGPSYYNFSTIVDIFIEADCCNICHDSDDIATQLKLYMLDKDIRVVKAKKLEEIVKANEGSLNKTLEQIFN